MSKKEQAVRKAVSRREFLTRTAGGVALFHIVPSHVLGGPGKTPPSEKINVACIGVGGRGGASVRACEKENIVALADVDDRRAADSYKRNPKAQRFRDFRKMLDAVDNKIDAVTVGTPDHTHAVAVTDAIRRGKHVYCEKPLAHSIHEVRAMMKLAKEKNVVTQLGQQGHSFNDIRRFCEWIWDGAIGKVSKIHTFCNAFPQVYCQMDKLPKLAEKHVVPKELDYDLWLGPSRKIDYSPLWVPWNWRGWLPFGTGCVGDFGCHVIDPSFWAFDLGAPTSVKAEVDPSYDPKKHALVYPPGTKITYKFPANAKRGPIEMTWFDGKMRPPKPEKIDGNLPGTGAIVYGTDGAIVHNSHGGGGARFASKAQQKDYKKPDPTLPRIRGQNHHNDWLDSIRAGKKAGSDFATFGGPLTEVALLGAVAFRFPGQELQWDSKAMKVTNVAEANKIVSPEYRQGWKLY
ncbi:MAG: Gfo/Idh/MocA family oxidoreductase [Planctomycetota bacterium]